MKLEFVQLVNTNANFPPDPSPLPKGAPPFSKAMKYLQNTPHLDPLPSSDEGRGDPAVSVKRTPVCVCERSVRFPLPFGSGEDQGEGLHWEALGSLTKWKWGRGEGKAILPIDVHSWFCDGPCKFCLELGIALALIVFGTA